MKKIGVILFRYYLFSPLLVNSIIVLAREGYEVHVFIDEKTYEASRIDFDEDNITIHPIEVIEEPRTAANQPLFLDRLASAFGRDGRFRKLKLNTSQLAPLYWRLVDARFSIFHNRGPFLNRLYRQTRVVFPDLFEFYLKVARYIDDEYICLLGIDWLGLIVSTMIVQNVPSQKRPLLIYYSLELLLEARHIPMSDQVLKSLERGSNNLCDLTVTQDRNRAQYLMNENNVSEDTIIYVPVSGLRAPHRAKGNYFHQKFGIDKSKTILLSAGTLEAGMMSLELAEAAQHWSDDLVLVLHSSRSDVNVEYVNQIKKASGRDTVFLSLNPVPWQSLPDVLSSADIGLIFYLDTGPNMFEIGSASNKLVQYLQVGLPIVAIDFPSLKTIVEEFGCGECAHDPQEIEALARKILADYDAYRESAFRCYQEKYEFVSYFKEVVDKIKEFERVKHNA